MPLDYSSWAARSVGVIENLFDVTCTSVNQHMSNGNSDITGVRAHSLAYQRDGGEIAAAATRFEIRAAE